MTTTNKLTQILDLFTKAQGTSEDSDSPAQSQTLQRRKDVNKFGKKCHHLIDAADKAYPRLTRNQKL